MPRQVRTHITGGSGPRPDADNMTLTPKHLTKHEFARRLYKLMIARGWHQSELARRSHLPRDSISVYMRGVSLPTPQSLQKLAAAFDMEPEELLPNVIESAIDQDNPSLEIKTSASDPSAAWLRVNRLVSITTAVKIADLLNQDDAARKAANGK